MSGKYSCRSALHWSTVIWHVYAQNMLGFVCVQFAVLDILFYTWIPLPAGVSAETLTHIRFTRLKTDQATLGDFVKGIDRGKKISDGFHEKEHFKMFLWLSVILFLIAGNRKNSLQLTFSLHGIQNVVCLFKARFIASPCFFSSQM